MTEFLSAFNLERIDPVGSISFSSAEVTDGLTELKSLAGKNGKPIVGVFVGGRKLRGKRWPLESFACVLDGLQKNGISAVAFLGPEEMDIADSLRAALDAQIPLVFEPSVRKFAAMVSHLDLLICCDSGPMHLACAAGVRVVGIFQARDVARWSPPASIARAVSGPNGVTPAMVLEAALDELSHKKSAGDGTIAAAGEGIVRG